jgi:hypothetical protein
VYSPLMASPLAANPTRSFDVIPYARHNSHCRNKTERKLKDCKCPKWLYVKATQERRSARTIKLERGRKGSAKDSR